MANRLKMALIDAILSLKARRWSNRRITRELGVDRDTVTRHLRHAQQSIAAKAPIGATVLPAESNAAKRPSARTRLLKRAGRRVASANRGGKSSWPSWNSA